MSRLVRFLIITLTLGRIKWLMRLTWLWRFIVFLGITGWLAKMLRRAIGLDKAPSTEVDSAWADALRYTPKPATTSTATEAATTASAPPAAASIVREPAPAPAEDVAEATVSEATSEITGTTADGEMETITIHEVDIDGETESIVRIEDESGQVETLVTGAPAEEIDLANLGTPVPDVEELVVEEIVPATPETDSAESEAVAEIEIVELIETVEDPEPEPEIAAAPEPPRRKRASRAKAPAETVTEPREVTDEDLDPDLLLIDPDWVRGDGTLDCPLTHPVKAKANSMIYYLPDSGHYERTIADVCFASELDAEAAGYRAPRR